MASNIYDPDIVVPIGYGHEVGPKHPAYCPPISNMVAMGSYTQPGSRELRAAEIYPPNVSSGKGQFPANSCKNDYATLLLYPTTALMIGAPTKAVALYRFRRFIATLATVPFPVYDPAEIARVTAAVKSSTESSGTRSRRKEDTPMSEAEALSRLTAEHVIGQAPLGQEIRIENIKIRNVVVVGRLADWGLNLTKIFAAYPESTYEPDRFPGLKLMIPIKGNGQAPPSGPPRLVALNVFSSNRGLLIGNVTLLEVAEAFRTAKEMVAPYADMSIPDTAAGRNNSRLLAFRQYLGGTAKGRAASKEERAIQADIEERQLKFQTQWLEFVANM